MKNVIADSKKLVHINQGQRETVEYLEDVLAQAKKGELREFVFAALTADNCVVTAQNVDSSIEFAVLLTYLQSTHARQIVKGWLREEGYIE